MYQIKLNKIIEIYKFLYIWKHISSEITNRSIQILSSDAAFLKIACSSDNIQYSTKKHVSFAGTCNL